MYRFIVKQLIRRVYRHLSERDYETVLKRFGPASHFEFSGIHALGGKRRGVEEVRQFFQRTFDLFPDFQLEPQAVLVNGWPWNTMVATRFKVRATSRDGRPYQNEGMQFLRLRFGRVVEDYIYEDTQKLASEIERIARQDNAEAVAPVA